MTGGFGAVPEELHQTAGKIGDVVSGVGGLVWRGPSGDYGHPGVQAGWAQFIEDMKTQILTLRDKATEHGEGLKAAAARYLESDAEVGVGLGKIGDLFDSVDTTGMVGGGFTGGISDVVDRLGNPDAETGFLNPEVARRLDPDYVDFGDVRDPGDLPPRDIGRELRDGQEGPLY